MLASPITGLVRGLNALIAGLAIQLGQIAEQGWCRRGGARRRGGRPPEEARREEPGRGRAARRGGSAAGRGGRPAEDELKREEPCQAEETGREKLKTPSEGEDEKEG